MDGGSALDEFVQRAEDGIPDLLSVQVEQVTRERTVLTMRHRHDPACPVECSTAGSSGTATPSPLHDRHVYD